MYKHILLPTDGSELSARAIQEGIGFAKSIGARVTALHVTLPYYPAETSGHTVVAQARKHEEEGKESARRAFETVQRAAGEAGVECACVHRVHDAPWEEIINVAKERACDLVFMASHGRRGVAALVLGSETNKVLTHSKIPVLVTR